MDEIDSSTNPILLGRNHVLAPQTSKSAEKRETLAPQVPMDGAAVLAASPLHVLTLAPSGSKRLQRCIVPNLKTYLGSVVTIDPTGEAYATTAEIRRDMGQRVVRLDPFRVIDEQSDVLNPFDLMIGLDEAAAGSVCQDIAALIVDRNNFSDVWEQSAFGLISGVIGYLSVVPEKSFSDLYSVFHNDDVVYNLAVVLDTIGGKISRLAYAEIASFLRASDADRSRIITVVTANLKAFGSKDVARTFASSSFSLPDFSAGQAFSLYLVVPPARLATHGAILRLWVGTLMLGAMNRRNVLERDTLFMLDQCAWLGAMPLLEAAVASGARYNLRLWTFWQDLAQLRQAYPIGWLVNDNSALQVFGQRDYSASHELAALLGIEAEDLRALSVDEQIVYRDGLASRVRQL
jgi:type IV secretion system protein VirD4